jgi:hypothetical protein
MSLNSSIYEQILSPLKAYYDILLYDTDLTRAKSSASSLERQHCLSDLSDAQQTSSGAGPETAELGGRLGGANGTLPRELGPREVS